MWLICWMDDHDTGFHDHDISAGAVAVVSGAVREERLRIDGPPQDRTFVAGRSFHFSPADIHRVRHAGADPAVTIHVYSPPLDRMGAYSIDGDGVLARYPVSSSQDSARSTARSSSQLSARAPVRRSTAVSVPIRIRLTMSGANRPCSTTPGVALRRAASSAGAPIGPR